jgi:molybdate transport system substrate-binding protein
VPRFCPALAEVRTDDALSRQRPRFVSELDFNRAITTTGRRGALASAAIFLALLLFAAPLAPAQQTLRLAAAADLQPLLPPILTAFHEQTGIAVLPSYQASATLATEIINGAPFDLFLAADMSFPQRVIDAGKATEIHPVAYARGTLVLWTRNDSGLASLSLGSLASPAVRTIAIANAQHAPYGRAAESALQHLGLFPVARPKLVIAENIAQAAQYADSGNAQVGFISLTAALTPRLRADGHYIAVPQTAYAPIVQGAIVVRGSANAAAAQLFLNFLFSPETRKILAASGLQPLS